MYFRINLACKHSTNHHDRQHATIIMAAALTEVAAIFIRSQRVVYRMLTRNINHISYSLEL